jgi:O-antigen ligase
VLCLFVFYAAGPNAKARTTKFIAFAFVASVALLASPVGPWVIDHLPFVGTIDEGNVTYRQAVIDRSLLIIKQSPWLGSPYFINYMEDLRTGQGIIDVLNVYLSVAMAYGCITLAALVLFFVTAGLRCVKAIRANFRLDPDTSMLGAALLASLLGTLLTIYTVSNYLSVPYIYVALTALMVGYSRLPQVAPGSEAAGVSRFPQAAPMRRGPVGFRV